MPIYEYNCIKCKNNFEKLIFKHKKEITCPHCSSTEIKRLLSGFSSKKNGDGMEETSSNSCSSCSSSSCSSCQ